jgi:hypothetical protein
VKKDFHILNEPYERRVYFAILAALSAQIEARSNEIPEVEEAVVDEVSARADLPRVRATRGSKASTKKAAPKTAKTSAKKAPATRSRKQSAS